MALSLRRGRRGAARGGGVPRDRAGGRRDADPRVRGGRGRRAQRRLRARANYRSSAIPTTSSWGIVQRRLILPRHEPCRGVFWCGWRPPLTLAAMQCAAPGSASRGRRARFVADEIARGDLLDLSGSLPAVEMRLLAVHVRGVARPRGAAAGRTSSRVRRVGVGRDGGRPLSGAIGDRDRLQRVVRRAAQGGLLRRENSAARFMVHVVHQRGCVLLGLAEAGRRAPEPCELERRAAARGYVPFFSVLLGLLVVVIARPKLGWSGWPSFGRASALALPIALLAHRSPSC